MSDEAINKRVGKRMKRKQEREGGVSFWTKRSNPMKTSGMATPKKFPLELLLKRMQEGDKLNYFQLSPSNHLRIFPRKRGKESRIKRNDLMILSFSHEWRDRSTHRFLTLLRNLLHLRKGEGSSKLYQPFNVSQTRAVEKAFAAGYDTYYTSNMTTGELNAPGTNVIQITVPGNRETLL